MISQYDMKNKSYIFHAEYREMYHEYSAYIDTIHLKKESKDWRLKHIRGFLDYLERNKIKLINLTPLDVYNYMESISNLADKTRENRACCIRFFLDYLCKNNVIKIDGRTVLDKIRCPKAKNVINYYTNEELKRLALSINITTALGKRDYAIVMIFITYGLRLKDVRLMRLNNIIWPENKIIIRQHKDNEINEFPLIDEVKFAILDYIRNGRFKTESDILFLTRDGKTISPGGMYNIVDKYFKKAEINTFGKKHGPHSMRHSLGKSLLDEGNGLKEISSVFGHNNLESSKIYTKVDFKELKKLSLEVPTWKN